MDEFKVYKYLNLFLKKVILKTFYNGNIINNEEEVIGLLEKNESEKGDEEEQKLECRRRAELNIKLKKCPL